MASCGETVVQNAKMDSNTFAINSKAFKSFKGLALGGQGRSGLSKTPFWTTVPRTTPSQLFQEWPRQTKPKKGRFMNFSWGRSGTKVQCESCLFSQGRTPEFTKMGEIHELFVLALYWFGLPGRLLTVLAHSEF